MLKTEENPKKPSLHGHIPALDAIRGIAILLVTIYRFGGGTAGAARAVDVPFIDELGARGVDLFFVLSGFLITGILFDAKGQDHYFRNFYVRRSLRIFPLYYGVLASLILAAAYLPGLPTSIREATDHNAWLWFYGANILLTVKGEWCLGALEHFWSLSIEEHFYLVWPLVIYQFSRKGAMRVCGGLIAISVLGRVAWLASGGNFMAAEVFTLLRMDGLALGSWIALAARGEQGIAGLLRFAKGTATVSGVLALLCALSNRRLSEVPFLVWAVFFGSLLILMVAAQPGSFLDRLGHLRVLRFFGKYSYAMYVFQNLLIPLLASTISAPALASRLGNAWAAQAIYCVVMTTMTTLAAMLSWECFEKHFMTLKTKFTASTTTKSLKEPTSQLTA